MRRSCLSGADALDVSALCAESGHRGAGSGDGCSPALAMSNEVMCDENMVHAGDDATLPCTTRHAYKHRLASKLRYGCNTHQN